MRTTRFILPLVAFVLCVMPAMALAAGGGSTQAIIKDVAKDGKVNGHYTNAQLRSALKSPLLKQYGGEGAVESILTRTKPKTVKATPATGPSNNLPFTGADVVLFVAVGGGLVAAGLVLRRFGRRHRFRATPVARAASDSAASRSRSSRRASARAGGR